MTVALIIPAYRPDDALVAVVAGVLDLDRHALIDHVLVVDDGSGAGYAAVFDRVRCLDRSTVLTRATNMGKGAALKAGIREIAGSRTARAGIVTADADGQHAPADILRVAQTLIDRPDNLVLGVRQFDANVPFRNRLGNVLTRRLVRWRTGVALEDTQTGLRGWPASRVHGLLTLVGDRYDWELRALLSAIDLPITEVPVATIYTGQPSHFRRVRDSLQVYRGFRDALRERRRGRS